MSEGEVIADEWRAGTTPDGHITFFLLNNGEVLTGAFFSVDNALAVANALIRQAAIVRPEIIQ